MTKTLRKNTIDIEKELNKQQGGELGVSTHISGQKKIGVYCL